jgi:hypothetical protein
VPISRFEDPPGPDQRDDQVIFVRWDCPASGPVDGQELVAARWWSRSPSAQNGHRQLPDHNTCQSRASALAVDIGRQARWCSYFRLLGHPVATDNPDHKRAGYTRFKRSFGGQVKEYAGTSDLPIHAVKYSLYRQPKLSATHTYRSVAQATINAAVPSPRPKGG